MIDKFMQYAIDEALISKVSGGIPIGSVLVRNNKILGSGHNRRVQENNPILHAEIDCLQNAGRIGSYKGTTLYSTLMPCCLCAGAVVQFGIKKVVVGESETYGGADILMRSQEVEVVNLDLLECKKMMAEFIKENLAIWNEDIGND